MKPTDSVYVEDPAGSAPFLHIHGDAHGRLDMRAVIAWALMFRPDLIESERRAVDPPPGYEVKKCEHCTGYGVICSPKEES